MKKILITDEVHPLLADELKHDGFEVHYRPQITAEEVSETIHDYEGLIINSKVYAGKDLLSRAAKLQFVCRAGSGLEVIDLDFAKSKNIAAFNSPEGNRNAVAEHALGMLLDIMNNISRADRQMRHHVWKREENRGNELAGKTIGLLAYGNNAQSLVRILLGFDVNILAYDKYLKNFTNDFVKESTLEEIFEKADILSIHLPLTAETEYMVDYKFLSSFRKPIWLVNIARGKVLRTADLLRCLNEHKVIAAALDVFENEKPATFSEEEKHIYDQLIASQRVLLSPHIAGWTQESKRKIAEVLLEKIRTLALI